LYIIEFELYDRSDVARINFVRQIKTNYYKREMDYVLDRDVLLFLYDYFRNPR